MEEAKYLAGPAEIGRVLGVDSNTVNQWKRRDLSFPDPVVELSGQSVWDIRDVIQWAEATGRPVLLRDYEAPTRRKRRPTGPDLQ